MWTAGNRSPGALPSGFSLARAGLPAPDRVSVFELIDPEALTQAIYQPCMDLADAGL